MDNFIQEMNISFDEMQSNHNCNSSHTQTHSFIQYPSIQCSIIISKNFDFEESGSSVKNQFEIKKTFFIQTCKIRE